jgi:RNA polymerase sigma factor (TIGR02999 family)
MSDVTRLLDELSDGGRDAADALYSAVYEELRRLAADRLAREAPGQTLQATALVHEVWLRLVGDERRDWKSRGYFFGACAEAMRRILVERARARARLVRGGDRQRVDLEHVQPAAPVPDTSVDVLALDAALEKLAARDPVKARLVELRYFTGLSQADAARALDLSRATADRHWAYARAWLFDEIRRTGGGSEPPPRR